MTVLGKTGAALAAALAGLVLGAAPAAAQVDPAGCTPGIAFDPDIPTWNEVNGDSIAGENLTGTASRHLTQDLYDYQQAIVAATATNPRVRVVEKDIGETVLGAFDVPGQERRLKYVVVGTPENIANLDAGRDDGAFWSGVVNGTVAPEQARAEVRRRPAFVWATATPHGSEPAAGEALMRQLYELVARTDCQNARRLAALDVFIDPARNPDGRDNQSVTNAGVRTNGVRTTAWGYDPNRDFGTRNQPENRQFMPQITKYPGIVFIDAHQQSSGYFFPPNQDPVHHEISDFSLDLINRRIGPALQKEFNSQSSAYRNYDTYDLFAPVFGDSVPSLIMNAAGMTYEKGTNEGYGKQVYDHYLAIDETLNVASNDKVELLTNWIGSWAQAVDQGARCALQENKLVSPVNLGGIQQQPRGSVCGYFFKPDVHSGDAARVLNELIETGVEVYRLDAPVEGLEGVHLFGTAPDTTTTDTLPAGTLWIPSAQPQKHWLQAVLGEDPFIPFPYYYDVVSWSYSLNRIGAGNGTLTRTLPSGAAVTRLSRVATGGAPAGAPAVYAFNTDAMEALGLVTTLLDRGATVSRATEAFTSGGRAFRTGAALVDGASLRAAGIDLAALAAERNTPVSGLDRHPVARQAMARPRIGLYTNGPSEPTNPLRPGAGTGHCGTNPSATNPAAYCSALFVLTQKDRVPASMVVPVTQGDLTTANLTPANYTVLLNANGTIAAAPGTGTLAEAVQAYVNAGGRYVGTGINGITAARNAGVTAVNTTLVDAPGGPEGCPSRTVITSTTCFATPGTTFIGAFDTTNPIGWGHDLGGFVYRDSTANPVFDPATLGGDGGSIPAASAPVRFPDPPVALGFERNAATGAKLLAGRPAVVDQPFGAGRAILFSSDPFFRAWHEGSERVLLNALLYPSGAVLPADAAPVAAAQAASAADQRAALAPVAAPVPAAALPPVARRPAKAGRDASRDVVIVVRRRDGAALRSAVRAARVPRSVARRARFARARTTVAYVVRNGAEAGGHRPHWAGRIMGQLQRKRVKALTAKLG